MMPRLFVCCLMALVCAASAQAATLFEQPANASLVGTNSDLGQQESADNFALASDAVVTGAKWYGFHRGYDPQIGAAALDFSIAFFDDDEGLPDTEVWRQTLAANVTDTGLTVTDPDYFTGRTIYAYEVGLPSIAVTGGTPMWLSVTEADADTPPIGSTEWFWNYSTMSGTKVTRNALTGGEWSLSGGNLAFILTGEENAPVVPAPAAILLGALGAGCVSWLRRRRAL